MWLTFHLILRALSETNPRKASRRRRVSICRPRLEALEDRTLLSAYVVTTTADSGSGSLRDAITQVNADTNHSLYASPSNPSVDEIDFNITAASDTGGGFDGTTGVATIAPLSALPNIRNSVFINGYSQPGSSWNTLANDDNAVLCIQLNGRGLSLGAAAIGLNIYAGNTTVRGLVINGFLNGNGIILQGDGGDRIQGNFIGTDVSGTLAPYGLPNFSTFGTSTSDMANGITLVESSGFQHDFIGTDSETDPIDPPGWSDLAERNIISACGQGMHIIGSDFPDANQYAAAQTNNVIAGNFIGTDIHGTTALGNWAGLAFEGGTHDDLVGTNGDGTNDSGERNVISGNEVGVVLNGAGSPKNFGSYRCAVAGNWIGIDANGDPMGTLGAGVAVDQGGLAVRIGGPSAVLGNTIAYSGNSTPSLHYDLASNGTPYPHAPGVWILTVAGETPLDITVQGNSIYGNAGLGIDLGGSYPPPATDGVTLNDSAGHVGPNNFQNFPVLASATSSSTSTFLSGSFSEAAEANSTITLDFYASPTENSSSYGEGETYLGSRTISTDNSGNASFNAAFAVSTAGQYISATATDSQGNTSEFAADVLASSSSQTFAQSLQAALPQSTTGSNTMVIQANPNTIEDVVSGLSSNNLGSQVLPVSVYLNLASGTYQQQTVQVPQGMTLYINGVPGTTIDPNSPAFTVTSGNVVVSNVTFVTTGDAPTILVTGGSLTLRNDTIQESTGATDAAIAITGGTVDLGTSADPGGNTLNINGSGSFVQNATSNPVTAVGSVFSVNGVALAPDSLSGVVFKDFNDDGQVDFGEQGIAGVAVALTGTDFLGNAVSMSTTTDSDGAYIFANLQPGSYSITETPPAGYNQGINTVGTAGGSLSATDQFFVSLAQDAIGLNGLNYNFGEQPQASGGVQKGQTAGIGFWNNKNGQALIQSFNGGSTSTQLAAWLADTLPHIFGVDAGGNALIHADGSYFTNAEVAARFQQDFVLKGVKLDAQVLATALSVYATNATLDNTDVAANYGFTVSGDGVGTAGVNVGSDGDAFAVANNTVVTVLDLLKATDAQAVEGLLYNGDAVKRKEANSVYGAINDAGS